MRAKISMIAVNITAYPSVRKPALEPPEAVELEFARDRFRVKPDSGHGCSTPKMRPILSIPVPVQRRTREAIKIHY
jgi:hypothetical protein